MSITFQVLTWLCFIELKSKFLLSIQFRNGTIGFVVDSVMARKRLTSRKGKRKGQGGNKNRKQPWVTHGLPMGYPWVTHGLMVILARRKRLGVLTQSEALSWLSHKNQLKCLGMIAHNHNFS